MIFSQNINIFFNYINEPNRSFVVEPGEQIKIEKGNTINLKFTFFQTLTENELRKIPGCSDYIIIIP